MKIFMDRYCRCWLILLGSCLCTAIHAQQYTASPVSQYYRNGYLWNPAYAGSKDHPSVYALLNNSWIGFDGAPVLGILSGDMSFGNNSGAGIKLISEKSGLLQRTVLTLDYSFTLKFSSDKRLRLGVSAGTFAERINNSGAGTADPLVYTFNEKKMSVDGNLGAVYEDRNFTASGVWYNLRTSFQKGGIQPDMAQANFMVSQVFLAGGDDSTTIKPLASYKVFSASGGLFTLGLQLERNKLFNASLLWQNTGSITGSVGLRIGKIAEINLSYASNNKYGYGQLYEAGLGFGLH